MRDAHYQAIVRRAVICVVNDFLCGHNELGATHAAAIEVWEADMVNSTAFD